MSDELYVAGIDVGTTKICTIVARPANDGTLEILGVGLTPSQGLKRGVVVDREDAIESIKRSVDEAQRMAGLTIRGAYVGITGDHISSRNVTGRVHTTGGEITPSDVEKVIQSARDSVTLPPDREVIHSIVRDYIIDGQRGIKRPVGMSGNVFDVDLHVVTGMASVIGNLVRCVMDAGIIVQKRVLEPLATSAAVLTESERELGVVLIDIGGGTADVAVFIDGAITHTSAVPLGGEAITKDLAQLLRTSMEDAEALKRRFGYATANLISGEEMVQVSCVGSGATERVPRRLLAEIIQPRLEEVFQLIKESLRSAHVQQLAAGGAVLSGGASQLHGTTYVASAVLEGIPVRVGAPRNLSGLAESVHNPLYATGVGLAMMAAADGASAGAALGLHRGTKSGALNALWHNTILPRIRSYMERHQPQ